MTPTANGELGLVIPISGFSPLSTAESVRAIS